MKWSSEAAAAVNKAPFFIRKKIRRAIEKQVRATGKSKVSAEDVAAAKDQFLVDMDKHIKGYQLDGCFAESADCPNQACSCAGLTEKLEQTLSDAGLLPFLKQHVTGDLKYHHEFRVSTADCPNACSQPQIKDLGVIAAVKPGLTDESCSMCGECETACPDKAIILDAQNRKPVIDEERCLMCGRCIRVCPAGTMAEKQSGFRVMLGGRLGRHPRLALEVPGILPEDEVLKVLQACLTFYKEKSRNGQRFSKLLTDQDMAKILAPATRSQINI
jgi:anaerobic sulfite reductase subunit C